MKQYKLVILSFFLLLSSCSESLDLLEEEEYLGDPIEFAIIGDYGENGEENLKVSQMINSWDPDFIITLGDNNYNYGEAKTIRENIIQFYENYIYNPDSPDSLRCFGYANNIKQNLFWPSPGNHDYDNPLGLNPYLDFFTLPNNEEFYSFKIGPVEFFSLNSNIMQNENCCNGLQSSWLKEKLSMSTSVFKIVYFHHAPFTTSKHGNISYTQWPFHEWGIDAVLAGHNHVYERIKLKNQEKPIYLVNGLGGRRFIDPCNVNQLNENNFDFKCLNEMNGAIKATATGKELVFEFFYVDDYQNSVDKITLE